MKLKQIILTSAVAVTFASCGKDIDKKEQAETVVGIAWREDSDNEGSLKLCAHSTV